MVSCKALTRLCSDIFFTLLTICIEKRCRLEEVQDSYARLASSLVSTGEEKPSEGQKIALYVRVMKTETLFARCKKNWFKNREQKELFNLDFLLTKIKEMPRYLKCRWFLMVFS